MAVSSKGFGRSHLSVSLSISQSQLVGGFRVPVGRRWRFQVSRCEGFSWSLVAVSLKSLIGRRLVAVSRCRLVANGGGRLQDACRSQKAVTDLQCGGW